MLEADNCRKLLAGEMARKAVREKQKQLEREEPHIVKTHLSEIIESAKTAAGKYGMNTTFHTVGSWFYKDHLKREEIRHVAELLVPELEKEGFIVQKRESSNDDWEIHDDLSLRISW